MATIKITATVEKTALFGKRNRFSYRAQCGNVSGAGPSEKEALDNLALTVNETINQIASPTVMFDLTDPNAVWVLHPIVGGWGYSIFRSAQAPYPATAAMNSGGNLGRLETLERMESHWYAVNVGPIVDGIVALCTDRREWVCSECRYPTISNAPYVCNNPACGHERKA